MMTVLAAATCCAKAQTTDRSLTEHDAAVRAKDSTIKVDIINPAEQEAGEDAADWAALVQTITQKYDAVTADRTITKAKIYYYYGKDWPAFCAGIVNYTDHYELANDYPLLDKNAAMILKNSDDAAQLKEALRWSKSASASDPNNATYKATLDGLSTKIAGN